jgi:hypothetical protein
MIDAKQLVGEADVLLLTLDTLRYDVAVQGLSSGSTPALAKRIGAAWQRSHSPGRFTYASHQAMFAGFFPTPATPGKHERLFAVDFEGTETTGERTAVFDAPDIVTGFANAGYHTACIGGVGFFNKKNPLGNVMPGLFAESHWSPALGVTDPSSPKNQVDLALDIIARTEERLFLFINVSALHQPNCIFLEGATHDSPESQGAALSAVDTELERLFAAFERRGPCLCIVTSDHGTAYGEDGYVGHRVAHDVVWTVPFAEFVVGRAEQ